MLISDFQIIGQVMEYLLDNETVKNQANQQISRVCETFSVNRY